MPDCPTCGEPLDEHGSCATCSVHSGATASFTPVAPPVASKPVQPETAEFPVLVVRKGPQPGERFYLESARLSVGRDPSSDIFLNDMTVSRTHAFLELDGSEVRVRDAGSLNGTYVNGVSTDLSVLSNGDVVQIGTFQMAFFAGKERP